MPGRPKQRIIPITKGLKTEFRIIGGKLYLDRPETKGIQWASCQMKNSNKTPNYITRTFGTSINTSGQLQKIAPVTKTLETASRGKRTITSINFFFGSSAAIGQTTFKPKFTKFTPSCIDEKLKLKK
jgi:hypothetical protein